MSAVLDSALDPERLADCAANDEANNTGALAAFHIEIGARGAPRLSFPAMARSSMSAWDQHACLCEPGEAIRIRRQP